jgi:hypothetical protein
MRFVQPILLQSLHVSLQPGLDVSESSDATSEMGSVAAERLKQCVHASA